jgi:hypothetical protein
VRVQIFGTSNFYFDKKSGKILKDSTTTIQCFSSSTIQCWALREGRGEDGKSSKEGEREGEYRREGRREQEKERGEQERE